MRFVNQSKNLPGSKEILIKILTWTKKKKKSRNRILLIAEFQSTSGQQYSLGPNQIFS